MDAPGATILCNSFHDDLVPAFCASIITVKIFMHVPENLMLFGKSLRTNLSVFTGNATENEFRPPGMKKISPGHARCIKPHLALGIIGVILLIVLLRTQQLQAKGSIFIG
jgi:hypothetical protein